MAPYLRGAYARNQQANQKSGRGAKAGQPPRNDNGNVMKFKLLVNRSAIAALTANGGTLDLMQHQIDQFSKAKVTFIHVRKDASGSEIELVTDRDLEDFVVERLAALGTQIK